jgi:hypothetical protein
LGFTTISFVVSTAVDKHGSCGFCWRWGYIAFFVCGGGNIYSASQQILYRYACFWGEWTGEVEHVDQSAGLAFSLPVSLADALRCFSDDLSSIRVSDEYDIEALISEDSDLGADVFCVML